ncbi:MAG: 4-carboxy-4-hydroxy-2-oxoadipate aldolase/oxaloacetate decarboxylase [Gammaproteobacteria bacterium]|nr:4-carboxy-4-hydroxy-2-oxoadipate aldolase/oxaloacetate decarboxylase [Gammaproteobacteria bacterium]
MAVVIQSIKRADSSAVAELGRYGVATIHEAQDRTGLMAPYMRPIWTGAHISGTAVTVSVPPCDNWMIHVAVEQCQPGDIMVIAPTSFSDAGYFGDLLGASLKAHGVTGVVLDGGCRDVAVLKAAGFPVWSKAISAQGTVKETLGDVNVPIVCGGQIVSPGDVIIADDDGVVVVPRDDAAEIASKSAAREAREDQIRLRYEAGELGINMNNMRPRMAEKGLIYLDQD